MKPFIPFLAVLSLLPFAASAQTKDPGEFSDDELKAAAQDPSYFTIDEKTITIKKLGPTVSPSEIAPPSTPPGDDPVTIIDKIINIASKIWTIIEKNKPVVDIKTQYATAVPSGTLNWGHLEYWKPPRGTIYGLSAKNAYGVTVIDVRYQVLRTYGGRYKGKGRYLTAVTVEPLRVEVLWGYKFTMTADVPDSGLVNVGSKEDPIAGMLTTLHWRIQTPIKDSQGKGVYFLQGDGLFQEVGGPFAAERFSKVERVLDRAGRVVVR